MLQSLITVRRLHLNRYSIRNLLYFHIKLFLFDVQLLSLFFPTPNFWGSNNLVKMIYTKIFWLENEIKANYGSSLVRISLVQLTTNHLTINTHCVLLILLIKLIERTAITILLEAC